MHIVEFLTKRETTMKQLSNETAAELCLVARQIKRMPYTDEFSHEDLCGAVIDMCMGSARREVETLFTECGDYVQLVNCVSRAIG
jgi:hypothetical protein